MNTVEFKFKEKGQFEKWENLPVIHIVTASQVDNAIKWIKRLFQCVEIRWNYTGSLQGHYVDGNKQ